MDGLTTVVACVTLAGFGVGLVALFWDWLVRLLNYGRSDG